VHLSNAKVSEQHGHIEHKSMNPAQVNYFIRPINFHMPKNLVFIFAVMCSIYRNVFLCHLIHLSFHTLTLP